MMRSKYLLAVSGLFGVFCVSNSYAAEFVDSFTTNSLGTYTTTRFLGKTGSVVWENQRVVFTTGDNTGWRIAHALPQSTQGRFEIDFLGTNTFPATGVFTIRLVQDANNYYELSSYSGGGAGPGTLRKVANGVDAGMQFLAAEHQQNVLTHFAVSFQPTQVTATVFNKTATISEGTPLLIDSVEIELAQQHGYVDDLVFTTGTLEQPPVANAGADLVVDGGSAVTLDGRASSDIDGSVVGFAWKQTAGPTVTLSGAATSQPTFTAPKVSANTALDFSLTVTDDSSNVSSPDTVRVTVRAAATGDSTPSTSTNTSTSTGGTTISDSFTANTLSSYTQAVFWGTKGSATWDTAGQRLYVQTGDNVGRRLTRALPASTQGRFDIDFLGTQIFPSTGVFTVRLLQDANNFYELTSYSGGGAGPGHFRKVVGGTEVEFVRLAAEHQQNVLTHFWLSFEGKGTANAFGKSVLIANTTVLTIRSVELELSQQHGYLDNIAFTSGSITPTTPTTPTAPVDTPPVDAPTTPAPTPVPTLPAPHTADQSDRSCNRRGLR